METQIDAHLVWLFVHILSVILGFGAVIVVDVFGVLWMLKKVHLAQVIAVAKVTQMLIWIGWLGAVISGYILMQEFTRIPNLVWFKIFLVVLLGVNGVFLHYIKVALEKISGDNISNELKFRIGFGSFISQIGWWGAIIIGFMGHELHKNTPKLPSIWPYIGGSMIILIAVYIVGTFVTRKK